MFQHPSIIKDALFRLGAKGEKERGEKVICPFHPDTDPSMEVFMTKGDEHVHCYACGYHSDMIGVLISLDNITFKELMERYGLKRRVTPEVFEFCTKVSHQILMSDGELSVDGEKCSALEFLMSVRKHSKDILQKFQIGCVSSELDPLGLENALKKAFSMKTLKSSGLFKEGSLVFPPGYAIFPFKHRGQTVGFRGKKYAVKGQKDIVLLEKRFWVKWMPVFNHRALSNSKVYIAEGEDDVMKLEEIGCHAVGIGSALPSNDIISLILESRADEFIVALDNDEAGIRGAEKLLKILSSKGRKVGRHLPMIGKDISDEILGGSTEVVKATGEWHFYLDETEEGYFMETEDGRVKISDFTIEIDGFTKEPEPSFLIRIKTAKPVFLKKSGGVGHLSMPLACLRQGEDDFLDRLREVEMVWWEGKSKWWYDLIRHKIEKQGEMPPYFFIRERGIIQREEQKLYLAENAALSRFGYYPLDSNMVNVNGTKFLLVHEEGTPKIEIDEPVGYDKDFIASFIKSLYPQQLATLAYLLASLYKNEITHEVGFFPILWVWGEQGAGKSTFLSYLQALFSRIQSKDAAVLKFRITDSTVEGMGRLLSTASGLPIIADDFRESLRRKEELYSMARAAYDGSKGVKGTLSRQRGGAHLAVKERSVNGVLCFTSQTLPSDAALRERCILVEFIKKLLNAEQEKMMTANIEKLHQFGLYWITRSFEAPFFDEAILRRITSSVSRVEKSLCILEAMLLKLGIHDKTIAAVLKETRVEELTQQTDKDWFDFLDRAEDLLHNGYLKMSKHYGIYGDEYFWIAIGPICVEIRKHIGDQALPVTPESMGKYGVRAGGTVWRVYVEDVGDTRKRVKAQRFHKDTETGKILQRWCGQEEDPLVGL